MKKFWIIITLFFVVILSTLGGYFYGTRERVNIQPDKIVIKAPNGAVQNDLTKIEKRDIKGILETDKIQVYGQLFFKISDANQTQIRLDLANVPLVVKQLKSGKQKSIPNELQVALAKVSRDGTDYEYEPIGTLIFDEINKNSTRTAQFSTVIDRPLFITGTDLIQRIVVQATKPEESNFFSEDSPNLPIKARSRPAPYFFIEI